MSSKYAHKPLQHHHHQTQNEVEDQPATASENHSKENEHT